MNAVAERVDVRALLDDATFPLRRWEARRGRGRRPISDTQLHAAAWGMIEAFEDLLAVPCTELRANVRIFVTDEAEESGLEKNEEEESEGLNGLLETLRRVRGHFTGTTAETLTRALRHRDPVLFQKYDEQKGRALAHLNEWERTLVFFGAGTEQDAGVAADVIPAPRERFESASVEFDL